MMDEQNAGSFQEPERENTKRLVQEGIGIVKSAESAIRSVSGGQEAINEVTPVLARLEKLLASEVPITSNVVAIYSGVEAGAEEIVALKGRQPEKAQEELETMKRCARDLDEELQKFGF